MADRRKILLFCSSLVRGGTERVVANLAEYLWKQGIQVIVVTQHRYEREYTLPEGIPRILSEPTVEELPGKRIGNFLARYRKLRRIWKEQRPDCILSFIGKNNFMALGAAFFTHIPVVVSVRTNPKNEYASPIMCLLSKTMFAAAAGVVLQTQKAKDFFPFYIRKKAVVLKNSLNPAFVKPRFTGKRNGQIVAVGRIDENKNHEMIIRAFSQIAKDFPESILTIYGEGECRRKLQKLAEELGIANRINLPGAVENIADMIYESSVFVLSSNYEGMPNALLEAMCLGIPSISTDCSGGGPRELINDGVNGFLIPVGDQKGLEDRLRILLQDEKKAEEMGKQAAKLLEEYRPDVVNRQWLDYLVSRVGGNPCVE